MSECLNLCWIERIHSKKGFLSPVLVFIDEGICSSLSDVSQKKYFLPHLENQTSHKTFLWMPYDCIHVACKTEQNRTE